MNDSNIRQLETTNELLDNAIAHIGQVILGKDEQIKLALTCLLAKGHCLIEDQPGVGKTTLAHTMAQVMGLDFHRIQFTSDLLPADVLGVSVFNREQSLFEFHPGPIFSHFILADEINRATPKTQSALLEAMEEHQVTVEGETRELPEPFFVIATQNPRDFQGTFPLPDVQLDRFAMRLTLGYADAETEVSILEDFHRHRAEDDLSAVTNPAELDRVIDEIDEIEVVRAIHDYIVKIANATRIHPDLRLGVSTRGTLTMLRVARAFAATDERDYVTPDDVKAIAAPVLTHRMALTAEAELRGSRVENVLADIIDEVPVPRTRQG